MGLVHGALRWLVNVEAGMEGDQGRTVSEHCRGLYSLSPAETPAHRLLLLRGEITHVAPNFFSDAEICKLLTPLCLWADQLATSRPRLRSGHGDWLIPLPGKRPQRWTSHHHHPHPPPPHTHPASATGEQKRKL